MKETNKYQYIFSMKLAGILMTKGFKLLRINHNLDHDTKDVYVFDWSEEIQKEINNYKETKGEKKQNGNNYKRSGS